MKNYGITLVNNAHMGIHVCSTSWETCQGEIQGNPKTKFRSQGRRQSNNNSGRNPPRRIPIWRLVDKEELFVGKRIAVVVVESKDVC